MQTLIGFVVSPAAKLVTMNSLELNAFITSLLVQWSTRPRFEMTDLQDEISRVLADRFGMPYQVSLIDPSDMEIANPYTPRIMLHVDADTNYSTTVH